jgi:hypothetical protein
MRCVGAGAYLLLDNDVMHVEVLDVITARQDPQRRP